MSKKDFKQVLGEVQKIKKELDKEIDELVAENPMWNSVGETYGRILYFLSHGCQEEALDKIKQNLFNNSVEGIIFHNHYLANYALHRMHTLFPEARDRGIRFIGDYADQELTVDFRDLMCRMTEKLLVPKDVEELLSRFKDDIYWSSHTSWYCNHEESHYYQDAVENLQIIVGSADLETLKFVADSLLEMKTHEVDIYDYDRVFKRDR